MKRAVRWACVACVLAAGSARCEESPDPIIEGKPASEWIYRLTVDDRTEEAARALSRAGRPAIAPLATALREYARTDAEIRRRVPRVLAALGDGAVPALTPLLDHKDSRGSTLAALWLIEKDRSRLRSLLSAGRDEASAALVGVLPEDSEEIIRFVGDSEPSIRENAVFQLRHFRVTTAVPALLAALKDAEVRVRREALAALKEIAPNDRTARPALWERTKDEDAGARIDVARLLLSGGTLSPDEESALLTTLLDVARNDAKSRSDAIGLLTNSGSLRSRGFEALMADAAVDVRRRAASHCYQHLGNGRYRGVEADSAVVATLTKGMTDSDQQVRYFCLFALMSAGERAVDAVPALVKALQTDPIPNLRRLAAVVLRRIGPTAREAVPALLETLGKQNAVDLQDAAAEALWSIDRRAESMWHLETRLRMKTDYYQPSLLRDAKPIEGELPLFVRLLNEPDSTTRYNAARRIDDKAAAQLLDRFTVVNLLDDPEPRVRREGLRIAWLTPNPTAELAVGVSKRVLEDTSFEVRHFAVSVLGGFAQRGADVSALLRAAEDEHPSIRSAALHALENARHPKVAEIARRMLKDPHTENRVNAAWAIQRLLGSECVVELSPLLDDANEQVRGAAAEKIVEAGAGPVAVPALARNLASRNPATRSHGLYVLEKVGSGAEAALPALVEILAHDDDKPRRVWAANVLRLLGEAGKPAAQALWKACDDQDVDARASAAWALWTVDRDPRALSILAEAARIGSRAEVATTALDHLGADAAGVLPQVRAAALSRNYHMKYALRRVVQKIEAASSNRPMANEAK